MEKYFHAQKGKFRGKFWISNFKDRILHKKKKKDKERFAIGAGNNQRLFAISVRLNIPPLVFPEIVRPPFIYQRRVFSVEQRAPRWIIVRNRVIRLRGAILSRRIRASDCVPPLQPSPSPLPSVLDTRRVFIERSATRSLAYFVNYESSRNFASSPPRTITILNNKFLSSLFLLFSRRSTSLLRELTRVQKCACIYVKRKTMKWKEKGK